jgi:predicted ATPase/signal transduction histidine kinase
LSVGGDSRMAAGDGSDYRVIEALGETRGQRLYRAHDRSGRRVVLKVLGADGPASRRVERLENELRVAARVGTGAVVRPIAVDRFQGDPALVLEDVGGASLDRVVHGPLELGRFLRLGVGAAAALEDVHRHGVIHKDLKPPNLMVDEGTGQVRISGFGSASLMPRELQAARNPTRIEGTLAYMSPEQTGRVHRALDSRTDLYSLGVTFYEVLTGRLPFSASDPLGWVHCHIARAPAPPRTLLPALPETVSQIVMKLLAKPAEDRYQSAAGLRHDLELCQRHLEADGVIPGFPLATRDVWNRLQIPERLYGRQAERASLLAAFERVVREGQPQLVLLTGPGGIGKSMLGHELEATVLEARGLFLTSTFDPYQRNVPYAALLESLRDLLADVLTESDSRIVEWRTRLGDAMGPNAQLLVELLPALELVLGRQPPVVALPAPEAQARFAAALERFVAALPRPGQPVVLFLDDLQAADTPTLELLQRTALRPGVGPLLLVGTCRDDEPVPREVARLVESLRVRPGAVEALALAPLAAAELGELIADTLHVSPGEAAPLAAMVHEKTGGNPFFATQFLMELWQEDLVTLDRDGRGWQWQLAEIAAKGFTSNVVDFMVAKVRRLPADTQVTLRLGACLGRPFEARTLAALSGLPEEVIEASLLPAVNEGLLLYGDGQHHFAHDRIREAAYQLLDPEERTEAHRRIARWLLGDRPPEDLDEELFDAANQLARCGPPADGERSQVAEVNLVAGRRALAGHGAAAALDYVNAGLDALGPDPWAKSAPLAHQLLLARARCQSLCGAPAAVLRDCDQLLAHAEAALERAAALRLKQEAHLANGQFLESAQAGLDRLGLFGIRLPLRPSWEDALAERERVRRLLRLRPADGVLELPAMRDPELEAALDGLAPMAHFDPNLYCVVTGRMVALTLEHGFTDASVQWLSTYGFALAACFDEPEEGRRLVGLALALLERRGAHASRPMVLMTSALVGFWTDPPAEFAAQATAALEASQRIGALRESNFAALLVARAPIIRGLPLEQVAAEAERCLPLVTYRDARDHLKLIRQFARALQGRTGALTSFAAPDLDEAALRAAGPGRGSRVSYFWVWKMRAAFLAGDLTQALAAADQARALDRELAGQVAARDYHLYRALTLAALAPQQPPERREAWLLELREHERMLRRWSDVNPRTFRANLDLVSAELARLAGRLDEAERLYDESVRWARQGEVLPDEALAHERAADLLRATGRDEAAHARLRLARDAYARWGAHGKVAQLEVAFPQLQPVPAELTASEQLDLMSVCKASQAISGEVELGGLLRRLMEVMLEHSGAERACVLLPREAGLAVEAEARVQGGRIEVETLQRKPLDPGLPAGLLQYVSRTGERVVLQDACAQGRFSRDEYVLRARPRSVLCLPVRHSAEVVGLVYLENGALPGLFTPARLMVLDLLAAQAAISLEHARLIEQERTARAAAEEARRSVEQAVRARDEFLHVASHELNTPLAALLLNLEALKNLDPRHRTDPELLAGMAAVAYRQGTRLSRLVRELLDSTRIDRGSMELEPQRVELGALLRDVLAMYASELAQAGCPVSVEQAAPVVGWWDVERLHQLVLNLLSNAAKFGAGKPIEIRVEAGPARAQLSVIDHGIGIAPEGRERIFERYQRGAAGEHYGGLGLGLHICSHIAREHGGSIVVESEPGQGATFTVELPYLAR